MRLTAAVLSMFGPKQPQELLRSVKNCPRVEFITKNTKATRPDNRSAPTPTFTKIQCKSNKEFNQRNRYCGRPDFFMECERGYQLEKADENPTKRQNNSK